jgi:hypothetical protein
VHMPLFFSKSGGGPVMRQEFGAGVRPGPSMDRAAMQVPDQSNAEERQEEHWDAESSAKRDGLVHGRIFCSQAPASCNWKILNI